MALLKTYRKMTKPLVPALAISLGLNAIVASFLTYRQQVAFAKLQVYLTEKERHQRGETQTNAFDEGTNRYDRAMALWVDTAWTKGVASMIL